MIMINKQEKNEKNMTAKRKNVNEEDKADLFHIILGL